ncbi:MAG: hypothetical protein C0404_03730 [Verrucomicrobia bacterium]|nr:hypothetical protein [Verrucomicrobiota bacterium]
MKNLKLAGQFAIATVIFGLAAFVVHKHFAGPPPEYAHFPTHFLASALLMGITAILAVATVCVSIGALVEIIGTRIGGRTSR